MKPSNAAAFITLLLSSCGPDTDGIAVGAHYVAMGSSFASGPGIAPMAETGPKRCGRSLRNYANILAETLKLDLTDATCSGAKSTHILGPWEELPPQLDAVGEKTQLVTITVGGNDLGYIGGLMAASCKAMLATGQSTRTCWTVAAPTQNDFAATQARLEAIVTAIRSRANDAHVILVTYAAVLPPEGTCDLTPVSAQTANDFRAIAFQLKEITLKAAATSGAQVLDAAALTKDHHACAPEPWMGGYEANWSMDGEIPYHPYEDGMRAIAQALAAMLAP